MENYIKEAIEALERAQDDSNMSNDTYNEINDIILRLHSIID